MAGFLGWVRTDGGQPQVDAALGCLRHHPSFRGEVLADDGRCGVAVSFRPAEPPELFRVVERGLLVAILGAVLEHRNGQWHRFTAAELARRYLNRGIAAVSGLDGFYQLLVWDEPAGRVHILDDRVGSMWVQVARTPAGVAFAPEAKALFRLLPLAPKLDFLGVVSFLNMGYPIGTTTLFEGVRLLPPAHRMTVDLRTGEVEQERTWALRFEPEERLSLRAAVDLLHDAVLAVHQAPFGHQDDQAIVALTGGHDSRLVLAALQRLGRLPGAAVTWGATEAVPRSDVTVARELAAAAGVPHRFLAYSADRVAANARPWVLASELASDNHGYFAAGATFLVGSDAPAAVYLGDHVVGLAGLPRTITEAVGTVSCTPSGGLTNPVQELLQPQACDAGRGLLHGEMRSLVAECSSVRPKDVQDHLFLRLEAFRWIFSPGFYKEPMVRALRPLMLAPVFDVLSRLSPAQRVDKRVVLALLRKRFRAFSEVPTATANSLIGWAFESRNEVSFRAFLASETAWGRLEGTWLGGLLRAAAVRGMHAEFFAEIPTALNRRSLTGEQLVTLRRRLASSPLLRPLLSKVQPLFRRQLGSRARGISSTVRLMFRLAQLSLLQQCVEDGSFEAGSTGGGCSARWARGDSPESRPEASGKVPVSY